MCLWRKWAHGFPAMLLTLLYIFRAQVYTLALYIYYWVGFWCQYHVLFSLNIGCSSLSRCPRRTSVLIYSSPLVTQITLCCHLVSCESKPRMLLCVKIIWILSHVYCVIFANWLNLSNHWFLLLWDYQNNNSISYDWCEN